MIPPLLSSKLKIKNNNLKIKKLWLLQIQEKFKQRTRFSTASAINKLPRPQRFKTRGWGQQYLPDLMEKEAEVFGPRTISGFLSQVGAEEAMSADQVIWSEQGRLHLSYKGKIDATNKVDYDTS